MTVDQKKELADLEFNLRQLMEVCDGLSLKNQTLTAQLAEKERMLQVALNDRNVLKTKYDNLKVARLLMSVKQDDLVGAKQRLSKLVREIDKCIALLNE